MNNDTEINTEDGKWRINEPYHCKKSIQTMQRTLQCATIAFNLQRYAKLVKNNTALQVQRP